eukprot:IDg2184t1
MFLANVKLFHVQTFNVLLLAQHSPLTIDLPIPVKAFLQLLKVLQITAHELPLGVTVVYSILTCASPAAPQHCLFNASNGLLDVQTS